RNTAQTILAITTIYDIKRKKVKIILEGKHSIIPVTAVSVVNCNKVRIFWRLIDRGIIYEYPSSGF
ncbi:MAG: hypothetical protein RBS14_05130, partial [Atribacterota bacterium]|nr:hypothetical protein [Atribacterota bacterium]